MLNWVSEKKHEDSKALILVYLLSPAAYAGSGIKSAIEANAYNATNQVFRHLEHQLLSLRI